MRAYGLIFKPFSERLFVRVKMYPQGDEPFFSKEKWRFVLFLSFLFIDFKF